MGATAEPATTDTASDAPAESDAPEGGTPDGTQPAEGGGGLFSDILADGADTIGPEGGAPAPGADPDPEPAEADTLDESGEEPEPDDEAGEDAEGDATGDAAGDEMGEDTEPKDSLDIPEDTLEELGAETGTFFEEPGDVAEHINELRTNLETFSSVQQALQDNPEVGEIVATLLEGGDPRSAAMEVFDGLQEEAPDPELDPEGRIEYERKKAREEARKEFEEQQQEELSTRQQRMQQQAEDYFEAFAQRQGLEGKEKQKAQKRISQILRGDLHTGRLNPKMFDIIHRGLPDNYNEALEEARKQGRNEVIEEMEQSGGRGTPGSEPVFVGGGSSPEPNNGRGEGRSESEEKVDRFLGGGGGQSNIHDQI